MKRPVLLLFVLALAAVDALAQGVLLPDDSRRPFPHPVPGAHPLAVRSLEVETRIRGQVATTRVTQLFHNDLDFAVDGIYFYPLPEDATFAEFTVWDGERRIRGEVLERNEARNRYLAIVRRCWDPGLLEYAGANLFQARVFPVPARGEKRVEMAYSQILRGDHGLVGYTYPLTAGTRANPRPIGMLRLRVEIEADQGLASIYSPSHTVDVRRDGERRARVEVESRDRVADRNFQLFYGLSNADFGLSLLTYREAGEDGYFMVLVAPKIESDAEVLPKDVVFVFDTSGSMQERGKIDKARSALRFGVRALGAADRFNVVTFSTEVRRFRDGLVPATRENVAAAEQFADRLAAVGGTNIQDALLDALGSFRGDERPRYLVFMTDGLPTVGETDAGRIVRAVSEGTSGVRLFTFGVGYDVNTFLLDQLAARNGGSADYVTPDEDLEVKLSNFFARVASPVMTRLELDLSAAGVSDVHPRPLPDLFRGSQITLLGRYSRAGALPVALKGLVRGHSRTLSYEGSFAASATAHDFLPRLWGMRKVAFLLEEIRMKGESSELRDEVIRLAKKYSFVTPYTSYLAADDSVPFTHGRPAPQPRILPLQMGAAAAPSPEAARDAVAASIQLQAMKRAEVAGAATAPGGRRVGRKLFREQDGGWIDAEYDAARRLPVVELRFGTEELLRAAAADSELASYAALGRNVTVVHRGKVYRIRG